MSDDKSTTGESQGAAASSEPHEPSSLPTLPQPPDPSTDNGIVPSIKSPPADEGTIPEELDIFNLTPVAALKLFCGNIDMVVRMTGDIPPTPPITTGKSPSQTLGHSVADEDVVKMFEKEKNPVSGIQIPKAADNIDGVPFQSSAIGSPEAHHNEPLKITAVEESSTIQRDALARKFFSKRPPPISTEDYLLRLHRYCPMSTAVYLAASHYINRLAVEEHILPVTPRNVHRLLLASLRVAMKALEDLSYPHNRFAKVGGVSEIELGRLEISFCFLTDFELKMDAEKLAYELRSLSHQESSSVSMPTTFTPKLPARKEKRKASTVLPSRPAPVEVSAPS
ncbi:MAG: hypothetical protein Q9160_002756 [Pyrenula sp. 1 TL-2023]